MQQLEASLRRLGTDYVDIYYLHRDDPDTPLEETVLAVGDILGQGKARYFGVSNYAGWRIAEIVGICDALSVPRPIVNQPFYNAVNRMAEVEELPACGHFGLGVVPYSPLSAGILTGKYRPGAPPPKSSRVATGEARTVPVNYREESVRMALTIKAHAAARGMTAVDFAVNWVLNNRLVTAVIAGPRTTAQWRRYLGAFDHEFTAEDETMIDDLVPAGHASTPGYNDPDHPPTGRIPRGPADAQRYPSRISTTTLPRDPRSTASWAFAASASGNRWPTVFSSSPAASQRVMSATAAALASSGTPNTRTWRRLTFL